MKKILVPVDFSKSSIAALDLACGIAKKYKSMVTALHVVEGVTSESFKISGEGVPDNMGEKIYTYKLLERSRTRLIKLVSDRKYSSIKLDAELRMGNPFHGIRTLITNHKANLVVMGVKGRSQWEGMIIGSNTEKVIRCSNIPVMTVNKKPSTVNFKRIVYATSLSENEMFLSPIVRDMQKMYKSKIHFVHINTPNKFQQDAETIKRMEKFINKLKLKNYTINTYSDFSEESGILNFAEQVNADLIILSSRGRSGFVRLLAGSIAEDVMNRSKIPTLTYVVKG